MTDSDRAIQGKALVVPFRERRPADQASGNARQHGVTLPGPAFVMAVGESNLDVSSRAESTRLRRPRVCTDVNDHRSLEQHRRCGK
jgi:hypothetical protein